jgi:two-component system sensor histidine kinase KdpD
MKKIRLSFTPELFGQSARAVLAVADMTAILLLIGRATLGEAVIALLYLVPVGWSASQWGQGAGMSAAVAAALTFDFFFIPPFHTFTVGSLEGWLVLAIFLAVAIVVVGRIQSGLSRAQAHEREAIFMYELSAALAGMRTQSAVAHTLARQLQQMYQASLVKVVIQPEGQSPSITAAEPRAGEGKGWPDRVLPIWNAWGLAGEIQLWRGYVELPLAESRLLQNFASQAAQALERTRLTEAEERLKASTPTMNVN